MLQLEKRHINFPVFMILVVVSNDKKRGKRYFTVSLPGFIQSPPTSGYPLSGCPPAEPLSVSPDT